MDLHLHLNRPQALTHQRLQPGHSLTLPWGRGIGKSWFERWIGWYEQVARWDGVERQTVQSKTMRGVRIIHMMPTFKQCRDVHEEAARSELEGQSAPWGFLGAKVDHTRWHFSFPGGSWIQWFGAREANAARGMRCDIVTVDEADDIDPGVLDAVVTPWFSEPWSLRTILICGTPRRGRYGLLYREHAAGLRGDETRALTASAVAALPPAERLDAEAFRTKFSFHATWRDAPETVDPGYVEQVKATLAAQGQAVVFEREWNCNFDSAEGLVYPMWEDALHVRRPDPATQWTEVLVGVDHGWEDPGVMLVWGVAGAGADATVHLLEEHYAQHQLESWWIAKAADIRKRCPTARWYGDPSRPDRLAALERGAGIRFQETKNAIEDGVSAVADRMAPRLDPEDVDGKRRTPRLFVSPECRWFRWEVVNYRRRRDPRNADRFLDDIEDKNNHAMDAARYCIFSRFGRPSAARTVQGAGWTAAAT